MFELSLFSLSEDFPVDGAFFGYKPKSSFLQKTYRVMHFGFPQKNRVKRLNSRVKIFSEGCYLRVALFG